MLATYSFQIIGETLVDIIMVTLFGAISTFCTMLIENIQRRASYPFGSYTVRHCPYSDRLRGLNILSLSYRRKRVDRISRYQIFQGHIDLDLFTVTSYSSTRGYSRKLFKPRSFCRARSKTFLLERSVIGNRYQLMYSECTINF